MMDGMATPPRLVGCQREHADHSTHPIIRQAMAEERAVTAIMLDHEETYEKPCSGHRDNQGKPVAETQGHPHDDPQRDKSPGSDRKFKYAASVVRLTVAGEYLCPFAGGEPVQSFSCFHRNSSLVVPQSRFGSKCWRHRDGFLMAPSGTVYHVLQLSPPRLCVSVALTVVP